jgi:diguanylate cyclase (GGDEF)-like protein
MSKDTRRASEAHVRVLAACFAAAFVRGGLAYWPRGAHAGTVPLVIGHLVDVAIVMTLTLVGYWVARSSKKQARYEAALLLRMGQLEALLGKSNRAVSKERRRADQLASLSITDELTGLYNRRGFMLLAEQHLRLASRSKTRFAVLFADLDGLKSINDTLGHEAGDRAIRMAGTVLRSTLRESDILARLGGDEFVALVSIPTTSAVHAVARRIQHALEEENAKHQGCELSLSLGEAMFDPESQRSLHELISEADERMYTRKIDSRRVSGRVSVPGLRIVRSA